MFKKLIWIYLFVAIAFTYLIYNNALLAQEEQANDFIVSEQVTHNQSLATRSAYEQKTIDVYKQVGPAVVFITTTTLAIDPFDVFGGAQAREGSGSGVIVEAKRGIIVTNLHVIADAQKIEIALNDGKNYKAKLLGYDEDMDLAVLQLLNPPKNLTAVKFGDSSKLEVGQGVLAIGNPFGLDRTLTTGIISSLNRNVRATATRLMRGLIQTDAAINPGNSGGPLLDSDGRLIGLNTAILSQSGDSAGIGFATPINQIHRILPELITNGKIAKPFYGWIIADTTEGPMIRRIQAGTPADQAGLQPIERFVQDVFVRGFIRDFERADLIVSVNGKNVASKDEIEEISEKLNKGQVLQLIVKQGGKRGRSREVSLKPVFK
jgi:S1-C subfamily serine protease